MYYAANLQLYITISLCWCYSLSDVPPVIATPHHFLISIYRCNIFLVAVITSEGKEARDSLRTPC